MGPVHINPSLQGSGLGEGAWDVGASSWEHRGMGDGGTRAHPLSPPASSHRAALLCLTAILPNTTQVQMAVSVTMLNVSVLPTTKNDPLRVRIQNGLRHTQALKS